MVAPTSTALIPLLEAQIRLPVQPASPLARLDVSKVEMTQEQMSQVGAVLSTPIGLALPESNKDAKKFNLLPPEAIKRAKLKKLQERTLIGAVALIVLLGGFGIWRYFQVRSAQNNVNALQTSITALNAEIPKVRPGGSSEQCLTNMARPGGPPCSMHPSTGPRHWAI